MDALFTYRDFQLSDDRQSVSFNYLLERGSGSYPFTEKLRFPVALPESTAIQASLRALHLALGISYYKIFAGPTVIHPYAMDATEANFWNDVLRGGLGEFLYVNQLSPERLASFSAQAGQAQPALTSTTELAGALLGIGGGKDSIVAGELLKTAVVPLQGFVMATGEQRGQAQAVADAMGINLHVVERTLDRSLLEVQVLPGAYQGHVPISLVFGLVGTTLAAALGLAYVVVANEASASIPRITWEYGSVNHQWSKSFGFEQSLQTYVHQHLSTELTYFSAVRQLSSLAVAKLFAGYPQYYEVFTSDNSVFRIDPSKRPNARWSLDSPKSLSSFILLAPWLSEADLRRIFGRDFLSEPSLERLFLELLGEVGEPPLDCVGTVEELRLSLNLAHQQAKFETSYLMELAVQRGVIRPSDYMSELISMLELRPEEALPPELTAKLSTVLQEQLA